MEKLKQNSRIALVELPPTQFGEYNGETSNDIYSLFRLPPRAIPTLQSILLANGWENVIAQTPVYHGVNHKFTLSNEWRVFNSDLLLLSSITRTSPQSQTLIREYKQTNKSGVVIVGGFDPSFRYQDWLEKGADIVVRGEAELTLPEIMDSLAKDPDRLSEIPGLAFKKGDHIITTPPRALVTKFEDFALPYYDESIWKGIKTIPIETSRGCPMDCDFCSVTEFYGRKYRLMPVERVFQQLRQVKNSGKNVFFIDDNFSANPRALEICEQLSKEGIYLKNSSAQVSVQAANKPELLKAMRKIGIERVYVGFESLNDASLTSVGKNAKAEQNKKAAEVFRDLGFWVHGMMIAGLDGDTPESLREDFQWMKNNLDSLQLFSLVPLPGTRLARKMEQEGRILSRNYYLYDAQHVLVRPINFTPYQLQTILNSMAEEFYSPRESLRRLRRSPNKVNSLAIAAYTALGGVSKTLYSEHSQAHLRYLKSLG